MFGNCLLLVIMVAVCFCFCGVAGEVVFPDKEWKAATPENCGIDPKNVKAAVEHIKRISGKDGADETVIIKNGYVIYQGKNVKKRHCVYSCTKSFVSTCLGLLWDEGKLTPDTLAAKYYPKLNQYYPKVTLKDLGTFTAGYANVEKDPLEPLEPAHGIGEKFHYSLGEQALLAFILTRIAGQSLDSLFMEKIGRPIGITAERMQWPYEIKDNGIPVNSGPGDPLKTLIEMNALAMARFGWLYANDGVWNGKRLISKKYIDYATNSRTDPSTPPRDPKGWYVSVPGRYGLNWWTNAPGPDGKPLWPSAPARSFLAQGNKNNNCIIIPEWKLVVVRLGLDKIISMREYDKVFELLNPAKKPSNTSVLH